MTTHSPETIRECSKRCLDLFSKSADVVWDLQHGDASRVQNSFQDEFARFKLWAFNIGVFADIHASLDFRIRELPDVKELFLRQVDTINCRLDQLREDVTERQREKEADGQDPIDPVGPVPPSTTEKPDFENWDSTEMLQSIHQSIDWLHRLSNLVRKASFVNQNRRAKDFQWQDSEGKESAELTDEMIARLRQLYEHVIKRNTGCLEKHLIDRLTETMIIRHRRILYRRSRQISWAISQVDYTEAPKVCRQLQPSEPISLIQEPKPLKPSLRSVLEPVTTQAQDKATTVNVGTYRKAAAPSQLSRAISAPLKQQDHILIPPPPRAANEGKDFVCPYCCLILQSREARNPTTWAKHVKKDLDAYICVFEECDNPFEIYSSSKEWLSHMATQHRTRWQCFATDHEPLVCDRPEQLEDHMKTNHAGSFPEDQLPFIVEISSQPINPTLEHCPFCSETAENLEEHVGQHLREFALYSLPWPDCAEEGSQDGNQWQSDGTSSKKGTRETVKEDRGSLPPLDFDNVAESEDTPNTEPGDRLGSYGYLPRIAADHEPLHTLELLGDETIKNFARNRLGVDSIQALVQRLSVPQPLNPAPTSPPPPALATSIIINQKSDASRSLYQICISLKQRLAQVPGFDPFLEQLDPHDPVDTLWNLFRTGYPLLAIYNSLRPAEELKVEDPSANEAKKSKIAIFRFAEACMKELNVRPSDSFVITDLIGNDTSGFVKVTQVVNYVLDLAEQRGYLLQLQPYPEEGSSDSNAGSQMTYRDHIVKELVDTERKYVQDLENLYDLKKTLEETGAIPGDIIHQIFLNINAILDFQRRFLIRVETTNSMPVVNQQWGALFSAYEDAFDIYQPFISNQRKAAQMANQVFDKIQVSNHPVATDFYTLDGFLLKPIQRLVKYHLLLKDLIKKTEDVETKKDLTAGCDSAERVLQKADQAVNRDLLDEAFEDRISRVGMSEKNIAKFSHTGKGDQVNNADQGTVNVNRGGTQNIASTINNSFGPLNESQSCLGNHPGTNPRADRARILYDKGGLVRDSYMWIINHSDFKMWRNGPENRFLWVKGRAGTGKTMLLAGIVDELVSEHGIVSYFFCQRTDQRINNAISLLKGLIHMLADQDPSLKPLRDETLVVGSSEDPNYVNAVFSLSDTLLKALQGIQTPVYLIIDALDECEKKGRGLVLGEIPKIASQCPHVRWLVSSRDDNQIRDVFQSKNNSTRLEIELDQKTMSAAVDMYMAHKLSTLECLKHDPDSRTLIFSKIRDKTKSNFLWVSLICQCMCADFGDIKESDNWRLLQMLANAPTELHHMETLTLLKFGYREYELFKNGGCKENERLEEAIAKYEEAISVANNTQPAYVTGIIKANIYLTECHRELSHKNMPTVEKMEQLEKAEKCIMKAQDLAEKLPEETQDHGLLQRVRMEKGVLGARRVLLKMKEPGVLANPRMRGELLKARDELATIKRRSTNNTLVAWMDPWERMLTKAYEELHGP